MLNSEDRPNPGETSAPDTDTRDANRTMLAGVGIGVLGVVTAAIGGAVCPVCVIAAPAIVGVGAFRRWRGSRR